MIATQKHQRDARRADRDRTRWTALVLTTFLVIGGTVGVESAARADSFCDSPTSEGVGIDFTQTPNSIRLRAAALLSTFQRLASRLSSDAPKYVRVLLAADLVLVKKATKVTSAAEAKRLGRQSVALTTSVSGRAAVKYLFVQCNLPDAVDDTTPPKPTTPTTRPLNPARGTPTPIRPAPSGALDPCSLVTEKEATAALGSDPGPARRPDSLQCVYGPGFADTTVPTLTVAAFPRGNAGKSAFDGGLGGASHIHPEIGEFWQAVSVADFAYMFGKAALSDDATYPGDSATVNFLKGDQFVAVNILNPSGGARSHVVAVAVIAASRV